MSKTRSANAVVRTKKSEQLLPASKPEQPMPIDEFCRLLSMKDRRVELIGAFHFVESANNRTLDTEQNFSARFEAFTKKPV